MGYDPLEHFTGRAPLEAAAQGIELGPDDWAIRCNLVTIEDQTMRDFTAGHISTEEATQLLATAQEAARQRPSCNSVPGVSYRNLLIYRGAKQPAPVHARHAGHAAARPHRQVGARRLSARAGQRSAEPT